MTPDRSSTKRNACRTYFSTVFYNIELVYSPNASIMEPQTGFEPAFAIQLPYSPFVAEVVTAALVRVEGLEPPWLPAAF